MRGCCYFVMEATTHAMDGFYDSRETAEEILRYMRECHPWGAWALCEVMASDGYWPITDEYFHTHRLTRQREGCRC